MELGYVLQFLFLFDADNELFDDAGQFLVETVVRSRYIVHPVVADEVADLGVVIPLIDADGAAAVQLHELHAGNVGEPVADVDHVAVGDAAFALRRERIQGFRFRNIPDAFVDPEDAGQN